MRIPHRSLSKLFYNKEILLLFFRFVKGLSKKIYYWQIFLLSPIICNVLSDRREHVRAEQGLFWTVEDAGPLYNKVITKNGKKYGIIEITLWIGAVPSDVQSTIGSCRLQPRSQMRKLISWITREGRCFISSKDTRLRFVGTQ